MCSSRNPQCVLNWIGAMGNREHGWKGAKPPRESRGYGYRHVVERRKWAPIVALGRTACWRCNVLIKPNEPWHLGHNDERTAYNGPEHKACNLLAASKRAHEIRNNKNPEPTPQTQWD